MTFVTKGTKTTTGGVVLEGHDDILIDGKPATSVGQKASCASGRKSCKGVGEIVQVGDNCVYLPNGSQAALPDYKVLCNCHDNFILEPQNGVNIGSGSGAVNLGGNVNMGAGVNINIASSQGGSNQSITAPVTEFKNVQPSISSVNTTEAASSRAAQTPQTLIYEDFTTGEPLEFYVEYTQKVVDLAVMSLEEAEEFANNLWLEYNGKDTLDNSKKVWDGAANAKDAYQLAKGLGGMGVVAYVKPANGKDYVIIKGYKRHLKTLVKGNRWRANNPQVVQLGLGTKNMARNLLKVGLVVDITFSVAINAVDVYVHDEKTMEDLVGNSGVDIVKGVIATGIGTVAAIVASSFSAPILITGGIFALVSVGMGFTLDWADNEFGVSDALVDLLKRGE